MGKHGATYLGQVVMRSEDEARLLVRRTLLRCAGHTGDAAEALDVSRPYLQHVLQQLGMQAEPIAIRRMRRARFRLKSIGGHVFTLPKLRSQI